MTNFDYIVANDFDRAWLNFELDLPLKPGKNGKPPTRWFPPVEAIALL